MLDVGKSGIWGKASASAVLIAISWFIVLLAENSRVPFDDPNTHLELTMIHEVMVLDHGGPAFGLILYGAALKLTLFCLLITSLVFPMSSGSSWLYVLVSVFGIFAIGIAIGIIESMMARLRLVRIPQLLITATLLAAFAVVLLLVKGMIQVVPAILILSLIMNFVTLGSSNLKGCIRAAAMQGFLFSLSRSRLRTPLL